MADESDDSQKTEDPTSRRLDEARKRGQVANSREINNLLMLVVFSITVLLFATGAGKAVWSVAAPFIEAPDLIAVDLHNLTRLAWHAFGVLLLASAVPLAMALVVSLGAGFIQFGLVWSAEQMTPSLDKISPLEGAKRMFSLRALAEFAKGLLKILVVGVVAILVVLPEVRRMQGLIGMEMNQLIGELRHLLIKLFAGVVGVVVVIALADFLYQRFQHLRGLRMSRQELKEEFKETEGDPLVKNRLRQLRMERARKRMMAEVPKSDVVITNPTHYAVALKYEARSMQAPKMLAKGVDKMALKIREVAAQHGIPIIENPPLARGLHASVEIDQEVTPEFYKAVAEVIGYVFRLKRMRL